MQEVTFRQRCRQFRFRVLAKWFILFAGHLSLLLSIVFYIGWQVAIIWEVALVQMALVFWGHRGK